VIADGSPGGVAGCCHRLPPAGGPGLPSGKCAALFRSRLVGVRSGRRLTSGARTDHRAV